MFDDEFKILKSEKRIQKIHKKKWSKYMQELINKNSNAKLKNFL